MDSENKRILNPLLNISVTGSTIEDFTQNAVLLPAAEPVISIPPDAPNIQPTNEAPQFIAIPESTPITDLSNFDEQQLHQHPPPQPTLQSVFSSFSSYLTRNTNSVDSTVVAEPAGLFQNQLSPVPQPPANIEPIPLFSPKDIVNTVPQIPKAESGSANNYRRGTLKRPTYAPIPGLSNNFPEPPQVAQNFATPPNFIQNNFTPTTTTSTSTNYFQPELSGYGSTNIINQLQPNQDNSTPFLNPITTTELLLPQEVAHSENSFLTPTDFYTYSNNTMNTNEMEQTPNIAPNLEGSSEIQNATYRPVYHHWFFKREIEEKVSWNPMSMMDSLNIETAYLSNDLSPEKIVATDGGRYDVNILRRERNSVYWTSPPTEVRRCSWFHKGNTDGKYLPYEENIATKLEEEFKIAFESNTWNRKVELPNGESVTFHAHDVLVLFPQTQTPDAWGNTPNQPRPRVVKRGLDEFHIEEGEPVKADHLLFMVHGIGSVCDLKFRTVEEVVDEFRSVSLQLVQSHYRSSCEKGTANRVEVLPVSWHDKLHKDTGVDEKLKGITLESIPRLRDFTNDTILDVLFYTSPVYCQTIIHRVGNEMNRIYEIYKQRNPTFNGGISLGGHSLGSLILFDLLCHQKEEEVAKPESTQDDETDDVVLPLKPHPRDRQMSRRISYMMGEIGTGQPQLSYPNLTFKPKHFFALGSPIGMFVTVRGLNTLGEQFTLPTCPEFYNIFHPYDPVAYRIESLVNPELAKLKPVLIPHHKGRKRMHLELKETMARVGADLKQKILDSMKSTWNSFYPFSSIFKTQSNMPNMEEEVDKVFEEQLNLSESESDINIENEHTDLSLGNLNKGKRIDYVLQEAPLEFFNEYIFALTSHVCYWDSEDTMLFILKEIYNSMDISTDSQIPQQTMTIERPIDTTRNEHGHGQIGVDPTVPMAMRCDIGPPPVTGFVRKV